MDRREFVKALAGSLVLFQGPLLAASKLTGTKANTKKNVIWVVLRGGLDPLHTLIPTFDKSYYTLRPTLSNSIKNDWLMLDDGFALHPKLTNMAEMYQQKQLLPIVAVSSGYKQRSHFDAQDFLESGLNRANPNTGWLGRALNIQSRTQQRKGVAISNSIPISLRDSERVSTWYPSRLKDAEEQTYQALLALYENDELLSNRLQEGLNTQMITSGSTFTKKGNFGSLATSCAKLMSSDPTLSCAMLECGGWDTHNNQASKLARQFDQLDNGLKALKDGLAEQWQDTVVIIATEFGRTAKENGTKGTDHGTGSTMFLAGGAIDGGKVLGTFPGLADEQLFQQRDLLPTSNTFTWIGTVLKQHWQLTDTQLSAIFPDFVTYPHMLVRT